MLVSIITFTLFSSGATLEVMADENNVLSGIFYQDPQMRLLFESYPELLLLDATYKLNDLRLPLYVMLAVDGNGESVIVALWIVTSEGRETLASMIQFFKQHNAKWIQTSVIMTDKDMTERDVLHAEFPSASLLLCLFHTLRSFGREITTAKMNISPSERMMVLDLLQKIAYTRSEQQYDSFYQDLLDTRLPKVVEYYNKNWHVCRHEWVPGLQQCTNYLQRTNNRVESINQKLKQVIKHHSSMDEFVADLLRTVNALREERIHRAAYMFQKQPVVKKNIDDELASFAQLLTPYAFSFLSGQVDRSNNVSFTMIDDQKASMADEGELPSIECSSNACSCANFTCMSLPCAHVIAFRRATNMPIVDRSLCAQRWMKDYYRENWRKLNVASTNDSTVTTHQHADDNATSLSEQQMFRKSMVCLKTLATACSAAGNRLFKRRYDVLLSVTDGLLKLWATGKPLATSVATNGCGAMSGFAVRIDDAETSAASAEQPMQSELAAEIEGDEEPSGENLMDISELISNLLTEESSDDTLPTSVATICDDLPRAACNSSVVDLQRDTAVDISEDVNVLLSLEVENVDEQEVLRSTPVLRQASRVRQSTCTADQPSPMTSDTVVAQEGHTDQSCDVLISSDIANDYVPAVQQEEVTTKEAKTSRSSRTSKARRTAKDMLADNVKRSEKTKKTFDSQGSGTVPVLSDILLPTAVPRRGRPKGCNTTAVGLPRKRCRETSQPVAFLKLSDSEKEAGNVQLI